ncbi:hypothetical protein Tco_0954131 [Tanacetum coccineum]|uniref:Zinc finger, CCHC-type n=1 Tax=Tanacetum coccineum TaxID=301880 RepID=A0ABQ5E1W0_9ASTR
MTSTVVNNSVFRGFFEKQKLTRPNFIDWYRNLRIVLSFEDKLTYLEHPIHVALVPAPGQQIHRDALAAHTTWVKPSKEIVGLMLMTMDPDIQKNMEHLGAYDMLKGLKTLYIDNLERLGHPVSLSLAVSLVLVSLSEEYDSFVQNYNMHGMGKTVNELHVLLKLHEQTLPKKDVTHALHAIRVGKVQKNNHKNKKPHMATKGNNGQGKTKLAYAPAYAPSYAPKPKIPPPPKKDNPAKDAATNTMITSGTKGKYEAEAMSFEPQCHLGHVSKKRIEKLQHDGLLNSTDIESFGKCVSCLSGKMAGKPYSHKVERP